MQAAQNGPPGCEVVHIEGQHHGFTMRPDLDQPVGPIPVTGGLQPVFDVASSPTMIIILLCTSLPDAQTASSKPMLGFLRNQLLPQMCW